MGTHPELSDRTLRAILANEMLVWRKLKHRSHNIPGDVKLGFFTALYRVQKAQEGEGKSDCKLCAGIKKIKSAMSTLDNIDEMDIEYFDEPISGAYRHLEDALDAWRHECQEQEGGEK